MRKLPVIRPENVTVFRGDTHYEIDLPDGDCQVEFEFRSDQRMQLYLLAGDKCIPLGSGEYVYGFYKVVNCKALVVKVAQKDAFVAFEVYHWPCVVREKVDRTPVAVSLPEPPKIDITQLMSRIVGEKLKEEFDETEVEIEELIEDLPPDIDEEFGPGYAELDEEFLERRARRIAPDAAEKVAASVGVELAGDRRASRARKARVQEDEVNDGQDTEVPAAAARNSGANRKVSRKRKAARREVYDDDGEGSD